MDKNGVLVNVYDLTIEEYIEQEHIAWSDLKDLLFLKKTLSL